MMHLSKKLSKEKRSCYLTALLIFVSSLIITIPFYIFFSPLSIILPFITTFSYCFYPYYKNERLKYVETESAFVFSLLVASFSYINRDIFNAIISSLKTLKGSESKFINEINLIMWKNVFISKNINMDSLNSDFIKEVDPSFQDVLSLIHSSLKEKKEKSIEGIKSALTFHSDSIFSRLIKKSRDSVNPTRIVFSILVIFPVFLLILLPLAVLFLPGIVSPQNLFIVFDILIPYLSLISLEWFSLHLLTKPSFYSIKDRGVQYALMLFIVLFVFTLLISFFIKQSIYIVLSFFLFSMLNFLILYVLYDKDYVRLIKNYSLMDKLPAFFVVLSKQLSKGVPFERAMIDAEKKEKIKVNSSMFLLGKDRLKMSSVLSSYSYFLDILREASRKDITDEIAGVIRHFLNLKQESEEKIRFINEETLHSAKLLIILIIPLIASVSSAFSDSLDKLLNVFNFGGLSLFALNVNSPLLTLILSLYTIEMTIILTLFIVKLEGIKDIFYSIYEISRNLSIAFFVFLLSYVLSLYFINISTVII